MKSEATLEQGSFEAHLFLPYTYHHFEEGRGGLTTHCSIAINRVKLCERVLIFP